MQNNSNNKKIAKNSIIMFLRTLLILFITLYTSRVVLSSLGVEDFGIFNVVGGVVSMLTFLNSAMVQASQRYITFAQGKDDITNQRKIYSTSVLIHFIIALTVIVILETIGLWYINNKVVLPESRLYAANWVFQFSVGIFILRILTVPNTASVVAHENFNLYAYVSIIDSVLQLLAVYLLSVTSYDSLISYGLMLFVIALINYLVYFLYCRIKYIECVFALNIDVKLIKEMFSFAGWAFVGGLGYILRNQGVNLVINLFCGPTINAARGVAYQASSAGQSFVASFQSSINPQITKRYAGNDMEQMMQLVNVGSKYSFLLLLTLFTPIMVKPEFVLHFWLGKEVPPFAAEFLFMAITMNLITSMGGPLKTAMQATGNIKLFQIVVGVIMCCDVPLAYLCLTIDIEPYLVTGISTLTALLCLIAEYVILNKSIKFDLWNSIKNNVIRNIFLGTCLIVTFSIISRYIPNTLFGFILICVLVILIYPFTILSFGVSKNERRFIINKILLYKNKIFKNE